MCGVLDLLEGGLTDLWLEATAAVAARAELAGPAGAGAKPNAGIFSSWCSSARDSAMNAKPIHRFDVRLAVEKAPPGRAGPS
jgi:hypothetical protein